jgi:G:T-mismatch repair DNA endonuclease (very short patch repair protein)
MSRGKKLDPRNTAYMQTAMFAAKERLPVLAVALLQQVVVPNHPDEKMSVEEMALFFVGMFFYGVGAKDLNEAKADVRCWLRKAEKLGETCTKP